MLKNIVVGISLFRIATLAFDWIDYFVDEAEMKRRQQKEQRRYAKLYSTPIQITNY